MRRITASHLALLSYGLFPVGMIYSPALLSISMFAALLPALVRRSAEDGRWRWRPALGADLRRFWREPAWWATTLLFGLVLLSGLWSSDMNYFAERLRIKLPFLILPMAIYLHPRLREKQYLGWIYGLLVLLTLTCLGVGINYLTHTELINTLIKQGQAMPVPGNHIRFSLLMAFGVSSGAYLLSSGKRLGLRGERYALPFLIGFLFLFMHILSVRTGLVVLYASLGVLALRNVLATRQYLLGFGAIVLMLLMPLLAYLLVPSFKAKIDYMRWDRKMYREGKTDGTYSDSERILSLRIGWQIFTEAPVLGTGAGDLRSAVYETYAQSYPERVNRRMPHNQLLSVLAGSGLLGVLLFLLAYILPFFYGRNYQFDMLLALFVLIGLSFLVENTIENARGVGFYCFALLINLKYWRDQPVQSAP